MTPDLGILSHPGLIALGATVALLGGLVLWGRRGKAALARREEQEHLDATREADEADAPVGTEGQRIIDDVISEARRPARTTERRPVGRR